MAQKIDVKQLAAGSDGNFLTSVGGETIWASTADSVRSGVWAANTAYYAGKRLRYYTQVFDTEFEVMANHVSASNPLPDILAGYLRVAVQERGLSHAFAYPVGWVGRNVPVNFRDDGTVTTPYDFDYAFRRAFMATPLDVGVAGEVVYYVSQNGNDADLGTSAGTALKTMAVALAKADVNTILVEGSRTHYTWTQPGAKSINIIGFGDIKPRFFSTPGANISAFTATGGYTNVFQATGVFPIERPCSPFIDDEYGMPLGYKEVGSIAEVADSGPFTFFYDSATRTIYVYSTVAPVIGTDIYVTLQNFGNATFAAANNNANKIIYLENFIFTHCMTALSTTGGNLRALNVGSIGGQSTPTPAWAINSLADFIHKGCIAAYSGSDGFNVQGSGNYTEIDAIAYGSGNQGSSSQSSSVHSTINALRIRGDYENNAQQAITDVGSGQSIILAPKMKGPSDVSCIATAASRTLWVYDPHPAGAQIHFQATNTSIIKIDAILPKINISISDSAGIVIDDQLFTPRSLNGLKLWLDSSDPATITIDVGVSRWEDKSGQNNHAVQTNPLLQPTIATAVLNGRNTLAFASASSQVLDLTTPITRLPTDEWTVICVAKRAATAEPVVSLGSADSASAATRATVLAIDNFLYAYSASKQSKSDAGTYGDGTAYHWHAARHSAANAFDLFFDSATPIAETESVTAIGTTWAQVGAGFGSIDYFTNGNIAEIIYFDRVLTDAEMALIDAYFATKDRI